MRPLLILTILPALLSAVPALEIVSPILSQMDGGAPDPPGFEHGAGEVIFFSCRVAGYTKSPDEQIQLRYSVQAFDPQGVPLDEIYQNEMKVEWSPKDKNWQPKIATSLELPPLAPPGAYKILVKVEDVLAKSNAELAFPFQVRGHAVEASDTLVVRNFRFFHDENGTQPLEKGLYHPGQGVWARFDITGFKFGPNNKFDVDYGLAILDSSDHQVFSQPSAASDSNASFYPQRYVPGALSLNLDPNVPKGDYTLAITIRDKIANQTFEARQKFQIE